MTQTETGQVPEAGAAGTVAHAEGTRTVSNLTVDRRARLALELATFAIEHVSGGGTDALNIGRQLRAVADSCSEATMLSHGLVGRPRL